MKSNRSYKELVNRLCSVLRDAPYVESVSERSTKHSASNLSQEIEYEIEVKLRPIGRRVKFLNIPLWKRYTKLPLVALMEYVRHNDGFGQLEPQKDGFTYRTQVNNYFGNTEKRISGIMKVHIK